MKKTSDWLRVARFWLIVALLFGATKWSVAQTDQEIIAQMQRDVRVIRTKLLQTTDLKEQAQLQAQFREVLENALKRLSPKLRPMVAVGLKIVQPLQDEAGAYAKAASDFFSGDHGKFRTLKSREDIAARGKEIDQLESANQKLLARINSLESDTEALLKKEGVGARDSEDFMNGFRESTMKQMGALRAVRNLDSKMYVQWKNALALFDAEWGKWHATDNPAIRWDNPEAETKFKAIVAEIQTLAGRQKAAQQLLLSR